MEIKETKEVVINTESESTLISQKQVVKSLVDDSVPYIRTLLDHKKNILLITLSITVLSFIILWFVVPSYFESNLYILPDYGSGASSSTSALTSIAASFGLDFGTTGSPAAVYDHLVKSEAVLDTVIYSLYRTALFPKDSVNLIEYFEVEPDPDQSPRVQKRSMYLAVYEKLSEFGGIYTELDDASGILTVTVVMPEALLAAKVANKIASSLDNYVRYKRRSFARETREYLEERTTRMADSLRRAEEALKKFKELNRVVASSPELSLDQARLLRNVEILNTLYSSLRGQYELAKIDEVKDIPIINIQSEAREPVLAAGPRRAIYWILIIAFTFGSISGYYLIIPGLREYKMKLKKQTPVVKKA